MKITQGKQEKSRLGRLLVNRGYISETVLQDALAQQRASGAMLGEILIAAGWLAERDLQRVLKHQSLYRNTAALVAMFAMPLQPVVSLAATVATPVLAKPESGELYAENSGLSPLSDEALAAVAGQGSDSLLDRIERTGQMPGEAKAGNDAAVDVIENLKLVANTFVPILSFLDSDLTITGVHYKTDTPRYELLANGGLKLALPERIELVQMDNIRVSGSEGPSMGNVSLHNIRFDPSSSMTIYARP